MLNKATLESLQPTAENSFLIRKFEVEAFSAPYHFHPEVELTLILKGNGNRYVGSNMSAYTPGDLVLLGPNQPHCWKSENRIAGELNSSSIVLQFPIEFMGADFFNRVELNTIKQLLQRSKQGIKFSGDTAARVSDKIRLICSENKPLKRLLLLIEILDSLAISKEYAILNKSSEISDYTEADYKRINEVTAYIVDNFRTDVLLKDAAEIARMSVSAFCKYYKRLTRITFMETVMEYRINYAIQLLVNSDKPVSNVSFESGFKDISHFYRAFKKKTKLSPLQYRKKFITEIIR